MRMCCAPTTRAWPSGRRRQRPRPAWQPVPITHPPTDVLIGPGRAPASGRPACTTIWGRRCRATARAAPPVPRCSTGGVAAAAWAGVRQRSTGLADQRDAGAGGRACPPAHSRSAAVNGNGADRGTRTPSIRLNVLAERRDGQQPFALDAAAGEVLRHRRRASSTAEQRRRAHHDAERREHRPQQVGAKRLGRRGALEGSDISERNAADRTAVPCRGGAFFFFFF